MEIQKPVMLIEDLPMPANFMEIEQIPRSQQISIFIFDLNMDMLRKFSEIVQKEGILCEYLIVNFVIMKRIIKNYSKN